MYGDIDVDSIDRAGSPTRLTKPLNLQNLLKDGSVGFDIDLDFDLEDEIVEPEKIFKQEDLMKHINLDVLGGNDSSDDPDLSPFERLKKRMVKVRDDGKVMKMMKKEGIGKICPFHAHVSIHYQAYTEYKEVPFDCSYLRTKEPETYKLGSGYLLRGIEEAVLTMKAQEKASFLIHHDLAFGVLGCGARIPRESTILFEIELISFSENDDFFIQEENQELLFDAIVKKAEAHIKKGNERLCQNKNLQLAISHYKTARNLILQFRLAKDKDGVLANLLIRIFQNLAICANKKKDYKMVCVTATDAVRSVPSLVEKNYKLLFAWGKALKSCGEFEAAKEKLQLVKKMQPQSKEVHDELQSVENLWQNYKKNQQKQCQKIFNFGPKKEVEEKEKASEDFIEQMEKKLKQFKLDENIPGPLNLPSSLTNSEKLACQSIATNLGLKFQEYNEFVGTVKSIIIRK